jgi:hypothetical protein
MCNKKFVELSWFKGNDVIIEWIFYKYSEKFWYIEKIDDGDID